MPDFLCLSNREFDPTFAGPGPHNHFPFYKPRPHLASELTALLKLNSEPLPAGYDVRVITLPDGHRLLPRFEHLLDALEVQQTYDREEREMVDVRRILQRRVAEDEAEALRHRPDIDDREYAIHLIALEPGQTNWNRFVGRQYLCTVHGERVAEALCHLGDQSNATSFWARSRQIDIVFEYEAGTFVQNSGLHWLDASPLMAELKRAESTIRERLVAQMRIEQDSLTTAPSGGPPRAADNSTSVGSPLVDALGSEPLTRNQWLVLEACGHQRHAASRADIAAAVGEKGGPRDVKSVGELLQVLVGRGLVLKHGAKGGFSITAAGRDELSSVRRIPD